MRFWKISGEYDQPLVFYKTVAINYFLCWSLFCQPSQRIGGKKTENAIILLTVPSSFGELDVEFDLLLVFNNVEAIT